MLTLMLMAAGLGQAVGAPSEQMPAYEASFRPLRKSERNYQKLGPAGPFYPERAHKAGSSGDWSAGIDQALARRARRVWRRLSEAAGLRLACSGHRS